MIDIAPRDLETIKRLLADHFPQVEARAFGSRYRWTAKDYSDLDLALVGEQKLARPTLHRLREALAESDLPFRVDVLDWHTISPEFQQVIEAGYEVIQERGAGNVEEWETYRIEDLLIKVIDNRGKNPPFSDIGYPYIDTTCIVGQNRHPDYSLVRKYISEDTYANWFRSGHPEKDDLLIATVGANIGKICLMDDTEACVAQNTVGLRIDGEIADPTCIYYFLSSNEIQAYLKSLDVGSAQPSIKVPHLLNVLLDLPPLPTQRRIADILSALDDKIELNRQTNATLEAIAQAIFKEWFVNFNFPGATGEMQASELGPIPVGWRVGRLGDLCENKRQTIHPNDISPDTPYVGLEHIPRKSLGLTSWGIADDVGSQKTQFQRLDILFGKLRPYFHKVCVAPMNGICSTDILVIEPKKPVNFSFCLNHIFGDELVTYASLVADGTRMPRVNWKTLCNYQIVILPIELLERFNNLTLPFYLQIIANNWQSQTLAQIRDALLPKLMRGEVNV